jgi:5-methylthioribose kinase
MDINRTTAEGYLRERGTVPAGAPVTITELSGGISNCVLRAEWPGGCVVVKQSRPELRVEADWPFVRSRIHVERDCMRYLGQLVPGCVPRVVFADEERYLFGMTCAPPGGAVWKDELLAGRIDPAAAERAAALLARIHAGAAGDEAARERFADQTVLIQGRIDPYHLTAADANRDIAELVHEEVERLLATQRTLVLGDYAPKNTFVYPDGILVLDFEVAHWGDPGFDVAFCLNHLCLKAFRFPERARALLGAARAFWAAYAGAVGPADARVAEASTALELGCLMLARIDGKSPVEYIHEEPLRDAVRDCARAIVTSRERRLEPVLDAVEARVARLARAA